MRTNSKYKRQLYGSFEFVSDNIQINHTYNSKYMKTNISLNYLILILLSITFLSCSKKLSTNSSKSNPTEPIEVFSKSQVFVFQDGKYINVNLESKPIPNQGEDQFYKDMYLDLRYPANARENNIQGTVLFEVDIDEFGHIQSINRTSSLSIECDKEAQLAIERGCENGFEPYVHNGEIVKVRYLIPVNFRLR